MDDSSVVGHRLLALQVGEGIQLFHDPFSALEVWSAVIASTPVWVAAALPLEWNHVRREILWARISASSGSLTKGQGRLPGSRRPREWRPCQQLYFLGECYSDCVTCLSASARNGYLRVDVAGRVDGDADAMLGQVVKCTL